MQLHGEGGACTTEYRRCVHWLSTTPLLLQIWAPLLRLSPREVITWAVLSVVHLIRHLRRGSPRLSRDNPILQVQLFYNCPESTCNDQDGLFIILHWCQACLKPRSSDPLMRADARELAESKITEVAVRRETLNHDHTTYPTSPSQL